MYVVYGAFCVLGSSWLGEYTYAFAEAWIAMQTDIYYLLLVSMLFLQRA